MTNESANIPTNLSDESIGIAARLLRRNSPAELAKLTPEQLAWYQYQCRFSDFEDSAESVAKLDEYMREFHPEDDTQLHRQMARHKMKQYLCLHPLITGSPTSVWSLVFEDYIKTPEYRSDAAVKARKKRDRQKKSVKEPKGTGPAGIAGAAWRKAITERNAADLYWKEQRAALVQRHEDEYRAFGEARDANMQGWVDYVRRLHDEFKRLRSQ